MRAMTKQRKVKGLLAFCTVYQIKNINELLHLVIDLSNDTSNFTPKAKLKRIGINHET